MPDHIEIENPEPQTLNPVLYPASSALVFFLVGFDGMAIELSVIMLLALNLLTERGSEMLVQEE